MQAYLLDTQVALWIMTGDERLKESDFIRRFKPNDNQFIFHQVSTWEIQIKYSLGKLSLPKKPENFLLDAARESGFNYQTIDDRAIFMLDKLPKIHNDPFDKLLISHAIINGWRVISSDQKFEQYPISLEMV